MELTKEFIDRLRHNLLGDIPSDVAAGVMSSFDRAVATTLLEAYGEGLPLPQSGGRGPRAGSKAASERAKKAAFTRKVNKAAAGAPQLIGSANLTQEG